MSGRPDYDHPARPSTAQPPPAPVPGARSVHDLVIDDLVQRRQWHAVEVIYGRRAFGLAKYDTPLQAGNGRHPICDAVEEIADATVYLRQAVAEDRGGAWLYADALFLLEALCRFLPDMEE